MTSHTQSGTTVIGRTSGSGKRSRRQPEIRSHDLGAERDVDLHENPPAAKPAEPIVIMERSADKAPEGSLGVRVPRPGRGQNDDLAVQDLGAHVIGQREQVRVSRRTAGWLRHDPSIDRQKRHRSVGDP
jgi:hypothetical protein